MQNLAEKITEWLTSPQTVLQNALQLHVSAATKIKLRRQKKEGRLQTQQSYDQMLLHHSERKNVRGFTHVDSLDLHTGLSIYTHTTPIMRKQEIAVCDWICDISKNEPDLKALLSQLVILE